MAMDYPAALRYLYSFTDLERTPGTPRAPGADDDGLARVHGWFDRLGRPETAFHSVLVAGTKGKGSTANYIAGALRAAGYRVGLYTQPHLTSFRERLQVDGALLPEARLGALVAEIAPLVAGLAADAPELGALTTYEIVTGLGLRYFAQERVDWAVLEIGLGGRLDAVNAVCAPRLSVITSLSLDHMKVLGNTIAQIAAEKAGIIKPGTPVVSAPQPPDGAAVVARVAAERQAPLYVAGEDIAVAPAGTAPPCTPARYGQPRRTHQAVTLALGARLRAAAGGRDPGAQLPLDLPLLGAHQAVNAAVAAAACLLLAGTDAPRLTPAAIAAGFRQVQWPGRLEIAATRPLIVLDGAHNDDSAAQLAAAVGAELCYRRLVLVVGALADKDLAAILRPLLPLAAGVVVTQSAHPRAAPAGAIAARIAELAPPGAAPGSDTPALTVSDDVAGALRIARTLAGPDDVVLVAGSLSVVGDARAALGLGPPVDPVGGDFFYRADGTPPPR